MVKKKIKSTCEEFVESLSPKEREAFDREYEQLLLEEMLVAAMKQDNVSVRRLAKLAGVSPTIVQGLRSGTRKNTSVVSFFKILHGLGYTLTAEKEGVRFNINIGLKRN